MLLFLPQLKPRTHPYGGEPPIQPAAEAHGVSSGGAASGVASTSVAGASSDDRSDPDDSGAVAFFVKGASEEQRDAHYRSQRWAHALPWQIDRLYAARLHAMESHRAVLEAGFYPDEGRWPFMKMDAEAHFALVAARQLLRALRAFDGDDRLPPGLTNRQAGTCETPWNTGIPREGVTPPSVSPSRAPTPRRTSGSTTGVVCSVAWWRTQSCVSGQWTYTPNF